MRKSCLKLSPPQTPDLSSPSTPSGSGRTSPTASISSDSQSSCGYCMTPRMGMQKRVSFCAEEELEEVYIADEWDRSPAPVTPKLSYQDVLELKQLRLSLPRASPPATYRQPFTTSSPSSYTHSSDHPRSSSCRSSQPPSSPCNTNTSFPYSRFATQPSQTPSRWKNRRQSPEVIDPEILPYLEAVPIRLLPLLDPAASPNADSPPRQPSQPTVMVSPAAPTPPPSLNSEPIPPSAPSPSPFGSQATASSSMSNPSPTPPTLSPEASQSQALSITLSSPSGTISTPALPSPPPTPTSARRTPNFAFLPLLPVEEPPPTIPQEVVVKREEPRKIRMSFLPLMPTEESLASQGDEPMRQKRAVESPGPSIAEQLTPTLAPVEEPAQQVPVLRDATTSEIGQTLDVCASGEDPEAEAEQDPEEAQRAPSPTDTSTPSLSSASDTDTDAENEQDLDTDTDAEGDVDVVMSMDVAGVDGPCAEGDTDVESAYFAPRVTSTAGQTPPLGMLFPTSPCSPPAVDAAWAVDKELAYALAEEAATLSLDGAAPHKLLLPMPLPQKRMLAALPSPALVPPSPFSLYPPDSAELPCAAGTASPFFPAPVPVSAVSVAGVESVSLHVNGAGQTRRAVIASSSSLVVEASSSPYPPDERAASAESDLSVGEGRKDVGHGLGLGLGFAPVPGSDSGVSTSIGGSGEMEGMALERAELEEGTLTPSLGKRRV